MAEEVAAGYVSLYARMDGAQVASEISSVLESAASTAAGAFSGFGDIVSGLGKDLTIMSVGADALLTKAGKGVMNTIAMGESAAITFGTMGKAMGEAATFADDFMEKLNRFSVKTPFEFENTAAAVKQLLAMGFTANEILDDTNHGILVSAGNAASALGLTDQGLSNILLQFGHIRSMGKTMSYQMNALARNGLPAWKMLADYMGKSVEEVRAAVRAGEVDADTTIAALMRGMEQYSGQMERMSHTFMGIVSNFADAMKIPIQELRSGEGYKAFTDSLYNLTDPLEDLVRAFAPVLNSMFAQLAPIIDGVQQKVRQLTEWLHNQDPDTLARVFRNAAVALNSGPLLMLLGKGSNAIGNFISGFGATVSREVGIAGKAVKGLSDGFLIAKESGTGVGTAFKSLYSEMKSGGKYFNDLKYYAESFSTKANFAFRYLGRSVKDFSTKLKEPGKLTDKLGDGLSTLGRRASISAGQFKSWGESVKAYTKLSGVSERIKEFGNDLKNIGSAAMPAFAAAGNAAAGAFKTFATHLLGVTTGLSALGIVAASALAVLTNMGVSVSDLVSNGLAKMREMVAGLPEIVSNISNMFANLLESGQLEMLFAELTTTLPNILRDVVSNLGTLLTDANIGEAFKRVVTIIAATIAENGPIILDGLLKAFGAAVQGIADAIPIVVAYIPEFMKGIAKAIVDNGPIILDGLVRAFEGIAEGFGVALKSLSDIMHGDIGDTKTFDNLTTAMNNLKTATEGFDPQPFVNLATALTDLGVAVGAIAVDVLSGIIDTISSEAGKKAIGDLADSVSKLAEKLSGFTEDQPGGSGAKKLGDFIGGLAIGTIEAAATAIDGLATAIGNLQAALGFIDGVIKGDEGEKLTNAGKGAQNMADGFAEMSYVLGMNPLPLILESLSKSIGLLGGPDLYGDAMKGLSDLGKGVEDTGKKVGDAGGAIKDGAETINGALSNMKFDDITRKATGMADGMEGSFRRAVNSTSGFGSQVSANVSAASGSMSRIVSDSGVMATGVGNNFAAAGNNSQKMVPGIQSSTAKGTSAFNGFVSSIGSGAAQVGGFIGQIPGMFGSLWSIDVSGAGRAIMGGFLSGLRSMWGSITSFVGSIAAWIAAHKGPLDYDRKLLIPAGKAIMGGLYKGLQSSFKGQVMPLVTSMAGTIDQAFEGVTSPLPSNVSVSMAGMANSDVRGPVIMQPVWYVYGVNDPETFAHQSMRAMIQLANSEE